MEFKKPLRWVCGLLALIVAFQGLRRCDIDLAQYFYSIDHGRPFQLQPSHAFLLEGILADCIGLMFGWAPILWSVVGIVLLAFTFRSSLRNNTISLYSLILVLAFSRLPDTLGQWVGKLDPFLFCFLLLSVNRNRAVSMAGTALAAFCAPVGAVISAIGVKCVYAASGTDDKQPRVYIAALAAAADLILFKIIFGNRQSRFEYIAGELPRLARNGLSYGALTLLASIIVPLITIFCFVRPPAIRGRRSAMLAGWFCFVVILSCLLTLDHTRVATMLLFAPLMALLQVSERREFPATREFKALLFGAFLAARLVIPHIDETGPHILSWDNLRGLLGFEAKIVTHRMDSPRSLQQANPLSPDRAASAPP